MGREELNRIDQRLRNIQSKYADDPRTFKYAPTFGSATVDGLSLSPHEYWQPNCRLGYERHDRAGRGTPNSRNGSSPKRTATEIGEIDLAVPRDRAGTFEPVTGA